MVFSWCQLVSYRGFSYAISSATCTFCTSRRNKSKMIKIKNIKNVVEAQSLEVVWILLAPLAAYISKPGTLAPARLGFFFCTRCLHDPPHMCG